MNVQVNKQHYDFTSYVDVRRWNSYYHQLEQTLQLSPKTVLNVGKGDGLVETLLSHFRIEVSSFDFDPELQATYTGDVLEIKKILENKHPQPQFDVVLCFQLLEHLPYQHFEKVLEQFSNLAPHTLLSLPYSARPYTLSFNLPIVQQVNWGFFMHKYHRKFNFNGQHYWEIGYGEYTRKKIRKSIEKYFHIQNSFIPLHNHKHLFFTLQSKNYSV